jgi:cytochrome P450
MMTEPVSGDFFTHPGTALYERAAELRALAPVHRVGFPDGAGDAFVVVDHETAVRAFNDPRLSKRLDNAPAWFREQTLGTSKVLASNMLLADPPEHTRLRRLVSKAFVPRRMERMRPKIQEITDDLIDAFPSPGEFDLLEMFGFPLPMMVICELLGTPYADRPRFERWGRVLSQDPVQDGERARERKAVNDEVAEYFTAMLAQRRADPQEDLIGDLVRAADEDGMFTDDELVSTAIFLVIAGHKTTANLIGNGMHALLRHPAELARLRAEPELVTTAVEEFLRFEGSVDRGTFRVAAEGLNLGGVDIPRGSFVHLSVAAADHDPTVFKEPDQLDLTRSPNPHVAFGHGPHFCAGAPLARLEGRIAFATLLRRLPLLDLAVPAEELAWIADSSISRGLERLPVRIDGRLPR